MRSYLCNPEPKEKKTKILCVGFLVLAFLSFYLGTLFVPMRALFQLFSVLLLFLFIQITSKFLLIRYTYSLEEDTLYLFSRQAKKVKDLGSVPIKADTLFFDEAEWKTKKKNYPPKLSFSYCQNLAPEKSYYLLIPDEDRWIILHFEPDETLACLIREILEEKKKSI